MTTRKTEDSTPWTAGEPGDPGCPVAVSVEAPEPVEKSSPWKDGPPPQDEPDEIKPRFTPLPEIEGWERRPGGVPTYKRTSDGALMVQKTNTPINIAKGAVGLWYGASIRGRLTLDRETTAEVIADLADLEPPTGAPSWPATPADLAAAGWSSDHRAGTYVREDTGDHARLYQWTGNATPPGLFGWWRCIRTEDQRWTESHEEPANAISELDGFEPADKALTGWWKCGPDEVDPKWSPEAYRRGDLAVLLCTVGGHRWGAALFSDMPEDEGDPWPACFLFHDSKEDAMREAHEGEKAHPWGDSAVHPGWDENTRADEPPRDGTYQIRCGKESGVAMWTGSGWAALFAESDAMPNGGLKPAAGWPDDEGWEWTPLVPSVATVERVEPEHDPIRARVLLAYLGKFRHWARKAVDDDGSMSDDELRAALTARLSIRARVAAKLRAVWR